MFEDLRWFGFEWQEGPDCGGPFGPYAQSERMGYYRAAIEKLFTLGFIYPCTCSRQDVMRALQAPHAGENEPIYPGTCRNKKGSSSELEACTLLADPAQGKPGPHGPETRVNWRFRVPDGQTISFADGHFGARQFVAGKDFGDFVVWRHDGIPSYQLAVTVDDAAMLISEVVRGADLLDSTARQILLYRALSLQPPNFYHCPLVTDEAGTRLAKRHDALSLRKLKERGEKAEIIRAAWVES
jgi:glutamyl-tRNA synthetase